MEHHLSVHRRPIHLSTSLNIHYAIIQGLYWAASASMYAFVVVFLTARGFSTSEIGCINAVRTGIAIAAQFFYAYIGDKYKRFPLKYLITIIIAVSILANFILQFTRPGFLGMAALFLVFGITECSIVSLMDSLALQFVNIGVRIQYSTCRSIGSIIYAFICFGLGPVLDLLGAETVVWLHGILLILYVIAILTFLTFRSYTDECTYKALPRSGSVKALLMNHPQYRWVLIGNCILCFGFWPITNFLANIVEATGGDNTVFGIALFVGAASEMPMMAFLFPRLLRRFSSQQLLFLATAMQLVRWSVLIFLHNPWAIVAWQSMQMFTFALSLPAAVQYINDNIEEENRIKGQTLYNMAGNIGGTVGIALFGVVLQNTNTTTMISICCVIVLLAVLTMLRMLASPAKIEAKEA